MLCILDLIYSYYSACLFSAGKEIDCFECNSWDDPRCHDPFNFTAYVNDMPNIVACEGCCVKLVRDRGKGIIFVCFLRKCSAFSSPPPTHTGF